MSFFDDTNNFGKVLTIAGLIMALASLASIIVAAVDHYGAGYIVSLVGTLIYGLMIAGVGRKVLSGEVSRKINVLGSFVAVVGAGFIVQGFFTMIGFIIWGDASAGAVEFIISLILGLITMYIAKTVTDGKTSTLDRLFWFLLLIIFAIMFILSLMGIFSGWSTIPGALEAISSLFLMLVYVFLILMLLSDDVKREMGMA